MNLGKLSRVNGNIFATTFCPLEFTQPQFESWEPCNVTLEPPMKVNLEQASVRLSFESKEGELTNARGSSIRGGVQHIESTERGNATYRGRNDR